MMASTMNPKGVRKMKRTIVLMMAAVIVVAWAGPATAQNTISVQITNISKQIIAPPVVATHTWKVGIFTPGEPASEELTLLAEDGDGSALVNELMMSDEVLDVAAAGGMLMPGETVVVELAARGKFNRVSAVGMLVTTNDAFFGLDTLYLDSSQAVQRTTAWVFDAGTEYNSESCDYIPGPPCGNPFMRDTDMAEGFVFVHPGLHGSGDVSLMDWNWQNPAVSIAIVN
jgi:hypothetical protein